MLELNEETAIAIGQRYPPFELASQDKDLMPQQGILGDELIFRPEGRG